MMRAFSVVILVAASACLPRTIIECGSNAHCPSDEICDDGFCHEPFIEDTGSSSGTSFNAGGSSGATQSSGMENAGSSLSLPSSSSVSTAGGACTVPFPLSSGVTVDLDAVWAVDDCDVWMVGDGNTVLHWNGTSVERITGPSPGADLDAVWASETEVFVLSHDFSAMHTYVRDVDGNWREAAETIACDRWNPRMQRVPGSALWLACPDVSTDSGLTYAWSPSEFRWLRQGAGSSVWAAADHVYVTTVDGILDNGALIDGSPSGSATVAVVGGVLTSWGFGNFWIRHELHDGSWQDTSGSAFFDAARATEQLCVGRDGWSGTTAVILDGSTWHTVPSGLGRIDALAISERYLWLVGGSGMIKTIAWR